MASGEAGGGDTGGGVSWVGGGPVSMLGRGFVTGRFICDGR